MNRVCLLTRGEYGTGVREIIEKYGKKNVLSQTWEMKEDLPPILEEGEISLPDFENCDLILSYVMHPDVNLDIISVLKSSEKVLLMPHNDAPLPPGYHVYGRFLVGVLNPCCVIPPFENKILSMFREEFGTPLFHITTKNGRICEVEVVCHTRCGAADFVAENLVGVSAEEAYTNAGLLAQYHCQSSKGPFGSIHDAGKVHAKAVGKALKK